MNSHYITAAFMAGGLTEGPYCLTGVEHPSHELNPTALVDLLEQWDGGHLELVSDLTSYVEYAENLCAAGRGAVGTYPGVWYYEVAEPFGRWYHTHMSTRGTGETSDRAECQRHLYLLTLEFFQGGLANTSYLLTALDLVPK